ncbi:MAG TPA: YfhO family protein [Candidatus Obscuribacterales bacterium]
MKTERLAFWATLAALAAVLACYYFFYLSGSATFYLFDLSAGWEPILSFLGSRLKEGRLPLWNPYVFNGFSQISDPAPTAFYPLNLAFAGLSFSQALAVVLILQQLIGGVGAYLLVRSFGWGVRAAIAGATIFALSGPMFSLQTQPTLQGTIAWFVFTWWAVREIARVQHVHRFFAAAFAAVCVYMMIAAGVAEIYAPSLVFLGILSLLPFMDKTQAGSLRSSVIPVAVLQLASLFIGVLLSAPIILPAAEWARLSPRAIGLDPKQVFDWSVNWFDLACLAVPQPLSDLNLQANAFRMVVIASGARVPYLASEFVGPIALTLFIIGATDRSWKQRWFALALTIAAIIISLGANVPPLAALITSTKWVVFRYPIKAMLFALCGITVCAARGMQVLDSRSNLKWVMPACVIWLLVAATGIGLWLYGNASHDLLDVMAAARRIVGVKLLCAAALAIVAVFICRVAVARINLTNQLTGWLIALSAACMLVDAWQANQHPGPPDFYTKPSLVAQAVKAAQPDVSLPRAAVLFSAPYPGAPIWRDDLVRRHEYARQVMAPLRNISEGVGTVRYSGIGQTLDNKIMWESAMAERAIRKTGRRLATLCRLAAAPVVADQIDILIESGKPSVRYPPLESEDFELFFKDLDLNLALYRLRAPLPRVYFAPKVQWGTPHDKVRDYVALSDVSGFDPRKLTILEHRTAGEKATPVSITTEQFAASTATIVHDGDDRVVIDGSTPAPNYLVLCDEFYPGWKAFVDGKETTIYPANILFRAVLVPAGKHHVEFVYEPLSLSIGLYIFSAALLLLLILIGAGMAASKKSASVLTHETG